MVATLLARSSWRFYRQHPLQLFLSILGIVLGVGIVTAVLITNSSSQRAFRLSTEALYGKTTHQVRGATTVEQDDYLLLKKAHPTIAMVPVIEGFVSIDNKVFTLLGLDPFAEAGFARDNIIDMPAGIPSMLAQDGVLASQHGQSFAIGDAVSIDTADDTYVLPVSGTFQSSNPAASEGVLLADIALAQVILDRDTRIDRIDMMLSDTEQVRISESLPVHLKLVPAASETQTMKAMTRGFQINLTAMSLLSLLVGAFLIHNTMSFTVLQRRSLFAIMRITGISSVTLLVSILCEAIVISLVGSMAGVALGFALAHQLIRLTTQTINDLYFVLQVQEVWFSPALAAIGIALGVVTSVVAASISALQAARASPLQAKARSATEQASKKLLPILALAGAVTCVAGIGLSLWPTQSLPTGFLALALIILGYGLMLPALGFVLAGFLARTFSRRSMLVAMAAGSIERNISRTGLAIAALTIAVSATFGVDVMTGSFRGTVDNWLRDTLQSDVYVSAISSITSRADGNLEHDVVQQVMATDGVESFSSGRTLQVTTDVGRFDMLVLSPHAGKPLGMTFVSDNATLAWSRFLQRDAVLVSEPLANKYALDAGDSLVVFTQEHGDTRFEVAGVVKDYGSSHGKLTMSRTTFARHWPDTAMSSIGLVFSKSTDRQSAIEDLRTRLADTQQPLVVRSNLEIHERSLEVFDRTFEVTRVLRWLTVGVAFVGIFSALLALHLERSREFAVFRATGGSRSQLTALIMIQSLMMGLFAGLFALPLGWMMSEILIHVINVRSFGWHMDSFIPQETVSATMILAIGSAALAGIYPAWRLANSALARQLREE